MCTNVQYNSIIMISDVINNKIIIVLHKLLVDQLASNLNGYEKQKI